MNNLSNCLKFIGRIWCFSSPFSAMALPEWEIRSDDDPWKFSVFISAIVELFLSILLLLGAAVAFITSRFAKFCGLEPPCTYVGCCHATRHTEPVKGQGYSTPPSCKSKDFCSREFCPDCHPLRIHSKLHSNSGSNQEDGSCRRRSAFGSMDQDVSSGHIGEYHERQCSCSNSTLYKRWNQRKGPKHTAFGYAASSNKMDEDDLLLLSVRSSSESSVGFDAEDHCEISQVAVNSDAEWAWKESHVKRNSKIDNYLSLARGSDGLQRNAALEDEKERVHGIFPSLFKQNQEGYAEACPVYAVHNEFGVSEVTKINFDEFNRHEAKFADPEKQRLSLRSDLVQRSENIKGSSNDFEMMGSQLSWCSTIGQTANSFSVPMCAQSVRKGLPKDSRMVDARKEVQLNTHSQVCKDDRNNLVQDVELFDDHYQAKTNANDINDDIDQGEQEDSGLVNIAINLGGDIQGSGRDVSESENEMHHAVSKSHFKLVDRKTDDNDRLKKGTMADYSELSSQEATAKRVKKATFDGADRKDERLSEGEKGVIETNCYLQQGELPTKEAGKGVKDVLNGTIANQDFTDEPASINSSVRWGSSSEHVEEMAPSVSPIEAEDNEEEFLLEEEQDEGLDALKLALQAERSVLAALEAELENERNAARVATSEAMAMISRLQEEKSAMQIQVAQLQRMSEEKADYDEQAMALLKEILFKREKENIVLEKEVELYRETILAGKAYEAKQTWLSEGAGSPSPHSLKPLLLTGGEEEILSSIEARNQKQALASSEFYQSGNRSASWIPQTSLDLEELDAFSLDQNVNKQQADSPMSDLAASMSVKLWDHEERPRYNLDGGLHDVHNNSDHLKRVGRSVFPTNGEETQLILERLWVLEEELQKLRGMDGSRSQLNAHGIQQLASSPTYERADKSLSDSWRGQSVRGLTSKDQKEEVETDGLAEVFVPIHDVYEVQSTLSRSPPFAEERDPPEGLEGISGNSAMPTGSISESDSPATMARHKIPLPPRNALARKLFPSDEAPCTPVYTPQTTGWIVGNCLHPEDLCDHQELQAQSLVSREGGMTKEEIQQLAVRLKVLEEDRELLRETVESFKRKDAELDLLQEIVHHLRELRMAGFMSVSKGVFSEDVTATSPSKNCAPKKRRYCSGPGQEQMLLP